MAVQALFRERPAGERYVAASTPVDASEWSGTFSETTHDLICEHDLDGRILRANAAAALSLELPLETLCTKNLRDILADEARPQFDEYLETLRREGVAEGLISVHTARGQTRVWQYRNAVVIDSDGNRIVRGLARDVTEREEALGALRASERQLRSIIENAADIIGMVDASGRLQFHSPSMERLLGYSNEEISGHRFSEFVHEGDVDRANEFFEEQSSPDAPTRTIDFRVRHRDDSWRCFSVVASPVVGSGHSATIIINARDITDRVLLEAQLEQANRLNSLGKLAATVAHEFNNVLMGIQPFADLIKRPGVPPETIAKSARHITSSIVRGKRVALDILRFTNPATPSFEPVDVAEWWRQLAPEMQASVGNNVSVNASFSSPLTILADAAQLSQIFSNLINNARDAMPDGGRLSVSARHGRAGESFPFGLVSNPERFVFFTVEDSGRGMSENVLQHVFEPLFTTKPNGGTGLGLSVAHQVVIAHGGHIFAESTLGAGSKFHVFLPAAEVDDVAENPPPALDAMPPCDRVLIVDDEPFIAEGLAELLRDCGVEVHIAGTGAAAIQCCLRFQPDLAVVDIKLPDIDGFEVAKRISAKCPGVKILFASGHRATEAASLQSADSGFIQKPFDIQALIAAMAALYDGSEP